MSGPVAAWYEDPSSTQHQRWWDGERWTEHTRLLASEPVFAAPAAPPPAVPTPPAPPAPQVAAPGVAPNLGSGVWSAQPAGTAGVPNGRQGDGDTLAIVSLVSGVLWLFWVRSLAAIITGIVALRRKVTGGHQAMAIIGIVLGGISFLGAPVIAAVAIPVFLNQSEQAETAAIRSDLRNAAIQMETAYTTAGSYPPGNRTPLATALPGLTSSRDVEVTIVTSGAHGYCLEGAHRSGAVSWYDSRAGGIIDYPCG